MVHKPNAILPNDGLPQPSLETAQQLGLLKEEYQAIQGHLGRDPNFTELSIYSVMWSEHCSYKNSIQWLKTLPREGDCMLAKAGEENAGLVDIGDGLACAFKIESHNHPSAIEPYQGAATGVGGINRDIFTMGARPIAQLNSLRFGKADHPKTHWLMRGIVRGIGDYGNAFGIPTVGGEVFFDDCFQINPLVNAMSAGIVRHDGTIKAISEGPGNPVFIVGSRTGKDGIHGAAFASKDLGENAAEDLPSVQVGDPFQEKLLLEATLELIETGSVVGMQDMGAAGIICSTSEMSAKGQAGMRIQLDRVPTRQTRMQGWELLLSESQERMLVVAQRGRENEIFKVFQKWDIPCEQIGEVIEGEHLEFYMHDQLLAKVPADSLVLGGGAPVYTRNYSEPSYILEVKSFDADKIQIPGNTFEEMLPILEHLSAHPNLCSKEWVARQYDDTIGTAHLGTRYPSDAALVLVKENGKALALTVDCNSRYVHADPYQGAAIAVVEAARNIVCSGAKPLAVTNCLNFGNPYNPEVYWQFVKAIEGMGMACRTLNTPVTGGNVSFYNQSSYEGPVMPSPVIGMLGLLDDVTHQQTLDFKQAGDLIYLLGPVTEDLGSSQYLYSYRQVKLSPCPVLDIEAEQTLHHVLHELTDKQLVMSMHDVSDGGLWISLLESALHRGLGFEVKSAVGIRRDAFWFGEGQSRALVSIDPTEQYAFEQCLKDLGLPYFPCGVVTRGSIGIDGVEYPSIEHFASLYLHSLETKLNAP
ncbi:MAG: phosphoribosylformylglycinamidine synthase subunit PurL [Sphingomonadales bacterium]|nr:phosphoribosylformylglycinamidine synthase subunit PurL [Sphingomonadales bacterium]